MCWTFITSRQERQSMNFTSSFLSINQIWNKLVLERVVSSYPAFSVFKSVPNFLDVHKIPLLNNIGILAYFQTLSGEGDVLLWQSPRLPRQSCTRPGFETRWSCLGFCREISFFTFSVWLGDHVNGGLVELRLKPVSVSTWCILSSWRSLLYCRRI